MIQLKSNKADFSNIKLLERKNLLIDLGQLERNYTIQNWVSSMSNGTKEEKGTLQIRQASGIRCI